MNEIPLKERILRYMQKHHTEFIPSGEIQRLVATYTTQTPRTCVRRLQELHEAGLLERKLVKGHAHYKAVPKNDWRETHAAMMELWDKTPNN